MAAGLPPAAEREEVGVVHLSHKGYGDNDAEGGPVDPAPIDDTDGLGVPESEDFEPNPNAFSTKSFGRWLNSL